MNVKENLTNAIKEHLSLVDLLNEEEFDNLYAMIEGAKRIYISAAGRSFLQMKGFAMRLMHINYDVVIVGEVTTPSIKEGDLLIVGSGSGETKGILNQLLKAKSLGAKTFVITQHPNSSMAKEADGKIVLPKINSVQPGGNQIEQMLGMSLDSFITSIMQKKGYSVETILYNHANLE